MCGIVGFLDLERSSSTDEAERTVTRMAEAIAHRGPDGRGTWVDHEAGVAFGHRRLSIIDLSPLGSQPMVSRDGRWVLNFNGEIYNYAALRRRLVQAGIVFQGNSDTEVLLEAVAYWGVREAIGESNGMFAFALWDQHDRVLWLARDRIGEKPLYWGWHGGVLLFGSELKALRRYPGFTPEIDRAALTAYFRTGYVPSPYSIYQDIRKLPPGHLLRVDPTARSGVETPESYWSATATAENGMGSLLDVTESEATDRLERQLLQSVAMRMVADVPVGAFLSGGIDSSLVTALMQAQSPRPVRTFTIGFAAEGFDEAPFAREIAAALGTEHTELYLGPTEALDLIPRLPLVYDEPFADSSQIPTYLISRLARQHVTVALSGDGGDELFAGYDRLLFHRRAGRYLAALPEGLRRKLSAGVGEVSPATWHRLSERLSAPTRGRSRRWLTADRMSKLARVLRESGPQMTYLSLVSLWQEPKTVVRDGVEAPTLLNRPSGWLAAADPLHTFLWLDLMTYLPDDLLAKVDRAAMAVSLETRLPLLDPDLVALAWRMPLSFKVRRGEAKWLLKQVLARYVPRPLFERPKKGFSVPVGEWLRGPLRGWGRDLLAPALIRQQGYLDEHIIEDVWDRHQRGFTDASHQLWTALMFQAWLESQAATAQV